MSRPTVYTFLNLTECFHFVQHKFALSLKSVHIGHDGILEILFDTSKESLSKGTQCKETQKPYYS